MVAKSKIVDGLLFVGLSLVAGSAFAFTKEAKKHIPPLSLTAFRLILGTVCLTLTFGVWTVVGSFFPACAPRRRVPDEKEASLGVSRRWWGMAGYGFLLGLANNVIPYTLYPVAMNLGVNVGITALLAATSPLMVVLVAYGTSMGPYRVASLVLGLGGVACLYVSRISAHGVISGYSLVLLAAAGKASAALLASTAFGSFPSLRRNPLKLALLQTGTGALIASMFALIIDYPGPPKLGHRYPPHFAWISHVSWKGWAGVAYLGVMGSCVAYILQFLLIIRVGATRQISVDFLVPVIALVEGGIFFHDWSGIRVWVAVFQGLGIAFVLASLVFLHRAPDHHTQDGGEDGGGEEGEERPLLASRIKINV